MGVSFESFEQSGVEKTVLRLPLVIRPAWGGCCQGLTTVKRKCGVMKLENVDFRGERPGSELIGWITDITVYFLVFLGGLKSYNEG